MHRLLIAEAFLNWLHKPQCRGLVACLVQCAEHSRPGSEWAGNAGLRRLRRVASVALRWPIVKETGVKCTDSIIRLRRLPTSRAFRLEGAHPELGSQLTARILWARGHASEHSTDSATPRHETELAPHNLLALTDQPWPVASDASPSCGLYQARLEDAGGNGEPFFWGPEREPVVPILPRLRPRCQSCMGMPGSESGT